jgi:hypothetical protein
MTKFFSEDDLKIFERSLSGIQGINPTNLNTGQLAQWRAIFDEVSKSSAAKVGLMKLRARPGEHLYGVAVREGSDLWLTLWVRRSRKGEVFVMVPRAKESWDPHASYHRDGKFHSKSFGRKVIVQQRQPLNGDFSGTEHLGIFQGHGPKTVGAICDTSLFSGVVKVEPGVFGPRDGAVAVDLVASGAAPVPWPHKDGKVVVQETFRDVAPWLVLRAGTTPAPNAA